MTSSILDKKPEIKTVQIPAVSVRTIKPHQTPAVQYYSNPNKRGRGVLVPAEYDLADPPRIADVDSYINQSFIKKLALMFKEGLDFIGKNPQVIKYINARFDQISHASGKPIILTMREVGNSLIQKSNAFLVKVRDIQSSGGKVRNLPGTTRLLKPVAAYFSAPAETMFPVVKGNKIVSWEQRIHGKEPKTFKIEDVVHIYFNKKDGFIFGTPTIVPVIDDVRALRKIEENIELLIYQFLFPLFHYIVGTDEMPAAKDELGRDEIEVVKQEIQYMPSEGGIVTSHRHEIKAIGAEGRSLHAEQYLDHFKHRVFAGTGLSSVDFGDGNTTNKSTADSMSRNLIDSVKDFQDVFEIFFNFYIIRELLLEASFDFDPLAPENICTLQFREIDLEMQIRKESHAADQFQKNTITWDEARNRMGLEPIRIPSPEEVENGTDTLDQFPEWNRINFKLFDMPKVLAQSIDEPWSPAAKAAAKDNSLGITKGDLNESEATTKEMQKSSEPEKPKEKPKEKGKESTKASVKSMDAVLESAWISLSGDMTQRMLNGEGSSTSTEWLDKLVRAALGDASSEIVSLSMLEFNSGYSSVLSPGNVNFPIHAGTVRSIIVDAVQSDVNRLISDTVNRIESGFSNDAQRDAELVNVVFDTLQYRTRFIENYRKRQAFMFGKAYGFEDAGYQELTTVAQDDACEDCQALAGTSIPITLAREGNIPPHHPGCKCDLVAKIEE